jgi:hypothetical protein
VAAVEAEAGDAFFDALLDQVGPDAVTTHA